MKNGGSVLGPAVRRLWGRVSLGSAHAQGKAHTWSIAGPGRKGHGRVPEIPTGLDLVHFSAKLTGLCSGLWSVWLCEALSECERVPLQ